MKLKFNLILVQLTTWMFHFFCDNFCKTQCNIYKTKWVFDNFSEATDSVLLFVTFNC